MASTFVGVIPVTTLIAYLTLKIHHWYHGRRPRDDHTTLANKKPEEKSHVQLFVQQKPELETDRTRYEVHGQDLRHEADNGYEIKELPTHAGKLELPTHRWFHDSSYELEGESAAKELETTDGVKRAMSCVKCPRNLAYPEFQDAKCTTCKGDLIEEIPDFPPMGDKS